MKAPQVYWAARGRGPALVLINGWSASCKTWPSAWVRELAQTHRVICPDNRGSGWSRFADTPFTLADLADDVAAVLDAEEVRTATVLGISMGGMIAQELALRHPERVERLILVGTRAPAPEFVERPGWASLPRWCARPAAGHCTSSSACSGARVRHRGSPSATPSGWTSWPAR